LVQRQVSLVRSVLAPAHPGWPGKRGIKQLCVCVCVCVCVSESNVGVNSIDERSVDVSVSVSAACKYRTFGYW